MVCGSLLFPWDHTHTHTHSQTLRSVTKDAALSSLCFFTVNPFLRCATETKHLLTICQHKPVTVMDTCDSRTLMKEDL